MSKEKTPEINEGGNAADAASVDRSEPTGAKRKIGPWAITGLAVAGLLILTGTATAGAVIGSTVAHEMVQQGHSKGKGESGERSHKSADARHERGDGASGESRQEMRRDEMRHQEGQGRQRGERGPAESPNPVTPEPTPST